MAEQINEVVEKIFQAGERALGVRWKDGHESSYEIRDLRLKCPCATCVDEWTGEKRINEKQIPADVHPIQIEGVGRYGIRIRWSDSHATGIYTFEWLRSHCPCGRCSRQLKN